MEQSDLAFDVEIAARSRRLVSVGNFRLRKNRLTFLFGESGIGKSLIARAVYGLLDPEDLAVLINGRDYSAYLADPLVRSMREKGFFVFQEPSSHLNPLLKIREQLLEGALSALPDAVADLRQLWVGEDSPEVDKILEVYPKPFRPSGGEKQRILLAMALIKLDLRPESRDPSATELFVFDEPTGSLDNRYRDLFLDLLLKRFHRKPFTGLFITHDYSIIRHLAATHPGMVEQVDFRELTAVGERLRYNEFQAVTYGGWLEGLRREEGQMPLKHTPKPLLTVEPNVEVFGRTLEVSRDRTGREPMALTLKPGRLTYLKAPSGTGKTTLAKAVMGLIPAQRLKATLLGTRLTEATPRRYWHKSVWGKTMTMVFQHADEALNMHSTVSETFRGLPMKSHTDAKSIESILVDLFDIDAIPTLAKKKVWMLSGGQKQRLNLLRSLSLDTDVIILDEPLNGLDFESCTKVVGMIKKKLSEGKGMLVISHNEEIFDALVSGDDLCYLHVHST